ncbi:hypothetical protein [Thalassobacillus sp. C254]|uniref:hypothetical protein n=1 Tax=Thalassobacillus sp. C254 TaxID=1225341 RepID=UPI0006D18A2F|nr:hypothetical protein [Thalassobacillus sp. C254]
MNPLLERALREAGISKQQFEQMVKTFEEESPVLQDIDQIGNMSSMTMQNDTELAKQVTMMMIKMSSLEERIKELESNG